MARRRSAVVLALAFALAPGIALAASSIKATKEKGVVASGTGSAKPITTASAKSSSPIDNLPPELREQAKAMMAKRLSDDVEKVVKLRDEAERLLEDFIKEEPKSSPDLPEALLKLAEIKWEKAKERLNKDFVAWEKSSPSSRGPAPELDLKVPRALVKRVLDEYPWYAQYDLALYLDGAFASELGDDEDAIARFKVILEKYPKSRFSTEAHMAMGEAAFNGKADWQKAYDEYEEVLKHKDSELYGLAMFKSAWCLWRLGKQEEAAKRFTAVLEITSKKAGASISNQQQLDSLEEEALRALVDVFIEDEKTSAQDVYDFLLKIGGEKFAGKILRTLASAYDDTARYPKEVEAYELIRKLEPASPDGANHVLAEARAWAIDGDNKKLLSTYQRLLDEYLPPATLPPPEGSPKDAKPIASSGTWAKTQLDPAVLTEAKAKIERDLRTRATDVHARAQATNNRDDFELAESMYQLYLSRFRDDQSAYDVLFYAAEIEYHRLGRDSDAARDYLACAKLNPKGGLSRDALYNAISALERLREKELDENKGKIGEETETDKRFADTLAFYAATYPDDPDIPGFLLQQGVTYYDHKVYDPAIRIFGELLTRYPKSKEAADAGDRMIDSLVHAKDYANVETWARKLKTLPAYAGDGPQKRLDALIVQAVFKQGEGLSAKGDHAGSATAYLRAAKEFPKDERASKACVNAIIEAKTSGDLTTAREAADLAISAHANTPEAPLAAWTMAESLSAAGLLGDSASYDEKLVAKWQKDPHGHDASYNAVVARTALGDYDLAVKDANDYLRLYGAQNADDADEVTFYLGQAHEKAKKYDEAAKLYANYVIRAKNLDHRVEALVRLALVRIELKQTKGADEALAAAVKLGHEKAKVLKEGKVHAAHARYLQGEQVVAKYDAITLDATGNELGKRVTKKKDLLKESATIYMDCAKMGSGEWATAALYRIGYVFEGYANELKKTPVPKDATPDQVDAFHDIVDPIATMFSEKAIDAYENGWKKAVELKIFNHWTAEMRAALARLNDVEYAPLKESGLEVKSVGPAPLPAPLDSVAK